MAKKSWADLSPSQQAVVTVVGAAEVALTLWALKDLKRRPGAELRGPKALWFPALLVQPVGPIAYLTLARRARA